MAGLRMDVLLLFQAGCLALLLEGILLFMAPKYMRAGATKLAQLDDVSLRSIGLVTMLLGLGLMVLLNA